MTARNWNEIRLSTAIQHTPLRDDDPVYRTLHEALPDADVVIDPNPTGPTSTWRTYAECLRTTPRNATHRLVLQDDVSLCTSFLYGVREAIKQRPDALLSFFLSHQPQASVIEHLHAAEAGETWSPLDTRTWIPTQALCWPVYLIGPLLRYAERYPPGIPYEGDDNIIGRFCSTLGVRALQSCPSLVEHVHAETSTLPDGTSIVGPVRYAALCIGSYHPVDDVDWTTGAW